MRQILKKQIQLIKIGQKQLGIDDSTYREMLQSNFGVSSCTKLSHIQAGKFITMLVSKGFKIIPKKQKKYPKKSIPRKGTNVIRLVNANEMKKIGVLNDLTGWSPEAFNQWMIKKFGISKIKTAFDAFLVIEGLKGVFENRMKKQHGMDWWIRDFNEIDVRGYIKRHCPVKYKQKTAI